MNWLQKISKKGIKYDYSSVQFDFPTEIATKVKKHLAIKGYDITFGARPLKRIIQNMILDELALDIIDGKIKDGDSVTIDLGIKDKVLIKVS